MRLPRSEEHTSELQSLTNLVCRLVLGAGRALIYTLSLHDALPIFVEFQERRELWQAARKYLRSPLSSVVGLDQLPKDIAFIKSGETALAERTMLVEPRIPTYAIAEIGRAHV